MKPWFAKEADIIKFPEPKAKVIELPNVQMYPDFLTGVKDLHNRKAKGEISQASHDKLYTDLIHRFMKKESFENPWFLREAPEDEAIKNRVLGALNKRKAEDPIFDKVYKNIIGKQLDTRIQSYIAQHKDADIGASEMAFLVKEIPQLGKTNDVKQFVSKWNKGEDFIDIEKLIPAQGMTAPEPIGSVVADGIPKALFQSLGKNQSQFSKSDAGPAEGALAIMSKQITYAQEGGDLVIGGKKIEVKSGGRGYDEVKKTMSGGGRVYNDKRKIDNSQMETILTKAGITGKSVSVVNGMKPLPDGFPTVPFIKAASVAFFGKQIPSLVKTFGTPAFQTEWNKAVYSDYQQSAGHVGILVIGRTSYQYIVNGEQLVTVPQKSKGYLYSPKSTQGRDIGIQIALR